MIGKLSDRLTLALICRGQIDADERELYAYGFFILLSNLFFGIVACLVGAVCGVFFEAVLFYIAFRCIRQYAGGYHAATETRCEVLSSLAIVLAVLAVKAMQAWALPWLSLPMCLIGTICVLCFAPLDTPQKPLDPAEHKQFRKVSLLILLVLDVLFAVGYSFSLWFLCLPVAAALTVESVLLCSGKFAGRKKQQDKAAEDTNE